MKEHWYRQVLYLDKTENVHFFICVVQAGWWVIFLQMFGSKNWSMIEGTKSNKMHSNNHT